MPETLQVSASTAAPATHPPSPDTPSTDPSPHPPSSHPLPSSAPSPSVPPSPSVAPSPDGESTEPKGRLEPPESTQPIRIYWPYAIALGAVHLLALFALVGWLFSWSGLILGIAGHFVFGMFGVTIGYHRLLTHRGFTCPKWFEHTLAILGIFSLQDSPARWVAIHRLHHQHSDERPDPHSPLVNFLWGHVGWLVVESRDHKEVSSFERYARDLLRDPFYLRLERGRVWFLIYVAHAVAFYLAGTVVGYLASGTMLGGLQLGLSWLVWGVFVRTVFVLHGTWAVNSVTHVWGYRNYDTTDNSRNSLIVALFSHGEGWHNNHHADQRSARHGHFWYEMDMSWWVIWSLERLGLIDNVIRPQSKNPRARPR